jgi:hypothetical protein
MGMDTVDPTLAQPAPTGDGESVTDAMIDDLVKRREGGKVKYGCELKTNNGRDSLVDAYQEALDLCLYLRQKIMEKSTSDNEAALLQVRTARNKVNLLRTQLPQSMQWVWNDAMEAINGVATSLGEIT